MSTDWFLFSPSHKKSAMMRFIMVGAIGMGGVKVWPTEYKGDEFLRWAIENHVTDIVLVDENDQRLDDVAATDIDKINNPYPKETIMANDFTKLNAELAKLGSALEAFFGGEKPPYPPSDQPAIDAAVKQIEAIVASIPAPGTKLPVAKQGSAVQPTPSGQSIFASAKT